MKSNLVVLWREGALAKVTLNRPDSRNAINIEMCRSLQSIFEELDNDPDIRVVLLDAAGPAFCAGADLKERKGKADNWVRKRRIAAFAAYDAIERCSKPVIAKVHGAIVGSGGEIAMACDFVVASPDARFRFPELQWGTIGATQRLQRVVGKRRAKELLFTGRTISSEEAYNLGLVARLWRPGEPKTSAEAIAADIAKVPPLAITLTKRSVDLGEEASLSTGIRIELAHIEMALTGQEWRDGIKAFGDDARREMGPKPS